MTASPPSLAARHVVKTFVSRFAQGAGKIVARRLFHGTSVQSHALRTGPKSLLQYYQGGLRSYLPIASLPNTTV